MTNRMKICKIVSIFLVVVMCFNFLVLPVFAVGALFMACAYTIAGLAIGAVAELTTQLVVEGAEWAGENVIEPLATKWQIAFNNLAQNNESIYLAYDYPEGGDFTPNHFYVNPDLTGDELTLATEICNRLNEGNITDNLGYDFLSGTYVLSSDAYEQVKNSVVNSLIFQMMQDSGDSLASSGSLPTYSFDFVGPKQGLTIPTSTGSVGLVTGDFTYTSPLLISSYNGGDLGHYMTKSEAISFMASLPSSLCSDACIFENDYGCRVSFNQSSCALSNYIIYNGKVYYSKFLSGGRSVFPYIGYFSSDFSSSEFSCDKFVSADGEHLKDVVSSTSGLYCGICFNTNTVDYESGPFYPGYAIDTDDFTAGIGGGETEIPLSDSELAISDALAVGLINEDSSLTLDENGNIVSADGIAIGKLNDIIDMLKNGTLEFEDIQSYLQTISQ